MDDHPFAIRPPRAQAATNKHSTLCIYVKKEIKVKKKDKKRKIEKRE